MGRVLLIVSIMAFSAGRYFIKTKFVFSSSAPPPPHSLLPRIALTFLFSARAREWTLPHPSVSAGALSLDMIGSRPSVACPDWLPHRSHGPDWSHFRRTFYPNLGHIQGLQAGFTHTGRCKVCDCFASLFGLRVCSPLDADRALSSFALFMSVRQMKAAGFLS